VAGEDRIGHFEVFEQGVEITVERTGLAKLGVVGVAVTPKIQTDYAGVLRQPGGYVIPPVRIGTSAVQQHQRRRVAPVDLQRVEF
jgi:hypothetical protein